MATVAGGADHAGSGEAERETTEGDRPGLLAGHALEVARQGTAVGVAQVVRDLLGIGGDLVDDLRDRVVPLLVHRVPERADLARLVTDGVAELGGTAVDLVARGRLGLLGHALGLVLGLVGHALSLVLGLVGRAMGLVLAGGAGGVRPAGGDGPGVVLAHCASLCGVVGVCPVLEGRIPTN